ncbi:glycoside hydrolase [Paenibacillus puerhi]|uniref:glycoside hydrolase n=1 Tax=Paenibacillus puerhi TaxID=2692622 RepID=UPI00135804C9|nr:glycoside hydrolase [Paenibacillus puerhi]
MKLRKSMIYACLATLCSGWIAPNSIAAAENVMAPAAATPPKLISVDPSYQHAPFEGFGTALVWFANITGGWPEAKKKELADALYGQQGLEFNVARYNIGGEDAPETTPYMRKGGAVPGYWNRPAEVAPGTENWWDPGNPNHWNWTKDKNQLWWVLAAKERGATQFEAFSNSPPYFMTKSGYVSGNAVATENNLKDDQYGAFAGYLAEVVNYFKTTMGVEFQTLSPVNEPNTNYWKQGGRQEGSHWNPAQQSRMITEARMALVQRGLNTTIAAMDESSLDTFVTNWSQYTMETKADIGRLNTHTYGGSKRTSVRDIAKGSGKNLWMSEVDIGPSGIPQNFNDIRPGLALAERITTDIRQLEPRAWVTWQAIEDSVNMDAQHENMNWGLIQVDFAPQDPGQVQVNYNKKYYTMGNYSKFIRPGYRVIASDNGDTLAAIDPNSDKAVIVYRNGSTSQESLEIDLNRFGAIAATASATPYVTSAQDNLAQKEAIAVRNGVLSAGVQPESVTTFVLTGVSGVDTSKMPLLASREYRLVNKHSGKALEAIPASGASFSDVVQQPSSAAQSNQSWRLEKLTAGYEATASFKIVHASSGQVFGVQNGIGVLSEWTNAASQQWIFSTFGNGEYTIINRESGTLLEIGGFSTTNGAKAGAYAANGGANQSWRLVREAVVDQIPPIKMTTPVEVMPSLPDQVVTVKDDGTRTNAAVQWDAIDPDQLKQKGSFTVEGAVPGTALKATAVIQVESVAAIESVLLKTVIHQPPALPNLAPVTFESGAKGMIPVSWPQVSSELYAAINKFSVEGTVPGSGLTAAARVQVTNRMERNVALSVPNQTYPAVIASFTSAYDQAAHLNDGIVSLNDNPKNRWTNWVSGSVRAQDWAGIEFGTERLIHEARLQFYSDNGCGAPASLELQRWNGTDWVAIPGTAVSGSSVQMDLTISFDEISTSKLRVNMTSTGSKCIAITEMQVNGLVPVLGNDSSADNLFVNGQAVPEFHSDVTSYTVVLPDSTTQVPVIGVSTTDWFASYLVQYPASLPGAATILVTSEDGQSSSAYQVRLVTDSKPQPELAAELTAPTAVFTGQTFNLIYGLSEAAAAVFAQDIIIEFDEGRMEFIEAESMPGSAFAVLGYKHTPGKLRLLAARLGNNQGNEGHARIKLSFRVKQDAAHGMSNMTASQVIVSDGHGVETSLAGAASGVLVTIAGDLNHDNQLTVADLAILAHHYGRTMNDAEWELLLHCDTDRNGVIDIVDLAWLAKRILE